jgi:hypothetical protein
MVHRNGIVGQYLLYVDRSREILMKAGIHTIRVKYHSNCPAFTQKLHDWNYFYL